MTGCTSLTEKDVKMSQRGGFGMKGGKRRRTKKRRKTKRHTKRRKTKRHTKKQKNAAKRENLVGREKRNEHNETRLKEGRGIEILTKLSC